MMYKNIKILHDTEKNKFFVLINDAECLLQYSENNNTLNFFHTFVPYSLRGQGIAEKILKTAADFAEKNHKKVIPSCSYAALFFQRHKEYQDLLL